MGVSRNPGSGKQKRAYYCQDCRHRNMIPFILFTRLDESANARVENAVRATLARSRAGIAVGHVGRVPPAGVATRGRPRSVCWSRTGRWTTRCGGSDGSPCRSSAGSSSTASRSSTPTPTATGGISMSGFEPGDRVRVVADGRTGRVERVFKHWGERWYEVRIDSRTVCRGPGEDFRRIRG